MIAISMLEMWDLRLRPKVGKVDLVPRPFDAKSCDASIQPESLVLVHQKLPGSSLLSYPISDLAPSLSPCCPVLPPALGSGIMLRIIWVAGSPESQCMYLKGSSHWSMTMLGSKLALPPSSCVPVSRCLSFSVLLYIHLQNGDNNTKQRFAMRI